MSDESNILDRAAGWTASSVIMAIVVVVGLSLPGAWRLQNEASSFGERVAITAFVILLMLVGGYMAGKLLTFGASLGWQRFKKEANKHAG